MKYYELSERDHELIQAALDVIEKNYDHKYYNHTVGSAIRCKDGKVYSGINCDGIHGSCAEFIAMGAARSAGERDFDTIVAVIKGTPNDLLPPCGNCRQMLLEYSSDIKVILNDENFNMVKVTISDLLPLAYKHGDA